MRNERSRYVDTAVLVTKGKYKNKKGARIAFKSAPDRTLMLLWHQLQW